MAFGQALGVLAPSISRSPSCECEVRPVFMRRSYRFVPMGH